MEMGISNLVNNAIKYNKPKGKIIIECSAKNNNLVISISDTGIGINKEDLARLFDEFYRVENTINQNVKGTGLGLSLAKKIVEAHSGKMWVASEVNKGTSFYFTLPIIVPPDR